MTGGAGSFCCAQTGTENEAAAAMIRLFIDLGISILKHAEFIAKTAELCQYPEQVLLYPLGEH